MGFTLAFGGNGPCRLCRFSGGEAGWDGLCENKALHGPVSCKIILEM